MSNSYLTVDLITKEALRIMHEKVSFIGTINRQFDESFGNSSVGKTGNTLRIRLPSQYSVSTGRVISVQDADEQQTSLVVATQKNVAMRVNSVEMSQSLNDFSANHLQPALSVLVSDVENDVLQGCTKLVPNMAGTAGSAISSLSTPGLARAQLNRNLAPFGNRYIQMDAQTMGSLVNGAAAYFNPSGAISEQYREGIVARTSMADYYENERIWTLTNNGDIAASFDTYTIVNGDTDLTVSAWANPSTGMTFTIAGIYDCHPETKAAYPYLKQFVVRDGSTSTSISTYPIWITGAKKNVATVTGADITPSNFTSAVCSFLGATTTSYMQPLMYHKDAFTFATGELPLIGGAAKCSRQTKDGISLRVWQDGDIRNDELITRIDILYGYAAIRPTWACRMIGAAV